MAVTNKDLNLTIKSKYDRSGTSAATNDLNNLNKATTNLSKSQKQQLSGIASAWKSVHGAFSNVSSGMISGLGKMFNAIFSVKTLIMGLFAGIIAKGIGAFISLNAEFEKMKVTMDILTKGHGEEWFNKLNQWALNMPVSMQEVSKAFITLKAYGLEPSIKLMENLINVASILPESGRAITGIARAIGQIQAKTRLEGQELRQLAEWAVPGYEAVYTKIFKKISERTGKAVSELHFTMIDSATAIKAILETMEEHFGGAAKRISLTWSGLTIRLTNYVKEFFRQIGESGGMQPLKNQLENIVNFFERAFKSGEMQKATGFIGSSFGIIFKDIFDYFKSSKLDIKNWADIFISVLEKIIYTVTILINTLSGIKLILLAVKLAWVAFAIALNTIIFGIIGVVDEVVGHFKYLIDLLYDGIPGVKALQSAFASFKSTTSNMAEAQGENIAILGQMFWQTGNDIAIVGDTITNRWGLADKMVTDLRNNLAKYKVTEAIPPSKPMADVVEQIKPTTEIGKIEPFDINTSFIIDKPVIDRSIDEITRLQEAVLELEASITSGFSTAIQNFVAGSGNLLDMFNSMMQTIRTAFVKVVADMIAEWIVQQSIMVGKAIFTQKAITAATAEGEAERLTIESISAVKSIAIAIASGVKKIMIYAYEAAAAAFKALAGIPIIGPFLAIGAAAAALGTVMGFATKVASFEKGTGLEGVKQTGPAVLHKGEIVLNKKESDAYRAGVRNDTDREQSSTVNLNFTLTSFDSEDMEKLVRKKVIPLLQSNIRDFGKLRTAVREAG